MQKLLALTLMLLLLPLGRSATAGERPSLRDLLPASTVAYLYVADVEATQARVMQTSPGRIYRDPKLASFTNGFLQSALDFQFPASAVMRRQGEKPGASSDWRDLLSSAAGEVVYAFVPQPAGDPVELVLIDARTDSALVGRLVESQLAMVHRGRGVRKVERASGGQIVTVNREITDVPLAAALVRDSVYGWCEDASVLRAVNRAWDALEPRTLAANPRYQKWRERVEAGPPELPRYDAEFFVDVASMTAGKLTEVRESSALASSNAALGGRIVIAHDSYDLWFEAELLLDSPRQGFAKDLALGSGDTTAEAWVPREAATYVTVHWNLAQMQAGLARPLGQIAVAESRGGRAAGNQAEEWGIKLPRSIKDMVPHLDGRFSQATWFLSPTLAYPQATVLAAKLSKPSELAAHLEEIAQGAGPALRMVKLNGQVGYEIVSDTGIHDGPAPPQCLCVIDDWLLIANQPAALERAIAACRNPRERLAEELDYRLVASKIRRLAGDRPPSAAGFVRPAEWVRFFHEQLTDEGARQRLEKIAVHSPLHRMLLRVSETNPLPPLALFDRLLAPGGGVVTDDGGAIRLTLFSLRRQ